MVKIKKVIYYTQKTIIMVKIKLIFFKKILTPFVLFIRDLSKKKNFALTLRFS